MKILAFGKNETNTAYFGKQGVRGNARSKSSNLREKREKNRIKGSFVSNQIQILFF